MHANPPGAGLVNCMVCTMSEGVGTFTHCVRHEQLEYISLVKVPIDVTACPQLTSGPHLKTGVM